MLVSPDPTSAWSRFCANSASKIGLYGLSKGEARVPPVAAKDVIVERKCANQLHNPAKQRHFVKNQTVAAAFFCFDTLVFRFGRSSLQTGGVFCIVQI